MRISALEDMDQTLSTVRRDVKKRSQEMAVRYGFKDVWICAFKDQSGHFLFATDLNMLEANYVAGRMALQGTHCARVDNLERRIHELKASIMEGKLDEKIHLPAEQLIYYAIREPSAYRTQ